MKAKVCLGLSVCCLMFTIGGLVMNQSDAQIVEKLPWPPTSVVFEEDPYREHGLQVWSFRSSIAGSPYTDIFTVPPNKRFIVTDVFLGFHGAGTEEQIRIYIAANSTGSDSRAVFDLASTTNFCVHLNSGLVFDEDETFYACTSLNDSYSITISGYYVDL